MTTPPPKPTSATGKSLRGFYVTMGIVSWLLCVSVSLMFVGCARPTSVIPSDMRSDDERWIPIHIRNMDSDDPLVRYKAIYALGYFKRKDVEDLLIRRLARNVADKTGFKRSRACTPTSTGHVHVSVFSENEALVRALMRQGATDVLSLAKHALAVARILPRDRCSSGVVDRLEYFVGKLSGERPESKK